MMGAHKHTDTFNSLIHFYDLREIIMSRGMYTWTNNQDPPTLKKLDKSLVNRE